MILYDLVLTIIDHTMQCNKHWTNTPHVFISSMNSKLTGSDRPNPEPVRQKPNRTFGKTWVPPKRFGFWAERGRPQGRTCSAFREEPKGRRGRIVTVYGQSLLFSSHCPGYSGFPSGTTAGKRRGADLPPSPILPRLPSSLSACLR